MSTTATQTTTATISGPSLKVIKNGFGAEITGLNFANGVTEEGYRFIEEAVNKVRSALEPSRKWDLTDSL
jgi:alpha-ketoglutarate-dependent 2,4-dichlorophenoxyacetate dioxygenase